MQEMRSRGYGIEVSLKISPARSGCGQWALAGGWAVGNLGTDLVLTQVEFGERMQGVRKGRRGTRGCRVDQVKGQVEVQPCESTPT